MRILIVNKFVHVTGGADRNCLDLADALVQRRHEVAVLSTASPLNLFRNGAFVPATVSHANRDALDVRHRASAATAAIWNRAAAGAARELLVRFRPHVVHAHKLYPQLSVAPLVVASRLGVPVVQTLHDYELLSASSLDDEGGWLDRDESKASFRLLNTATFPVRRQIHRGLVCKWIACSPYVARRFATVDIPSTVLPYFVRPTSRRVTRSFDDRKGAVFAGRLNSAKGVLDVLEVARCQPKLSVTIAGYGPLAGRVEAAARELENLTFVDFVTQGVLLELFSCARVTLMPSRWQEPGGIVALESMSVGTPVVAYRSGGLAEYVQAAGGVVVDRETPALAEAAARLCENRDNWHKRSLLAERAVKTQHSVEWYLPQIENVYQAAVESHNVERRQP